VFEKVIGNGSFGVVYQAKLCDSGEMVAIKKVLQDKRFKVSSISSKSFAEWVLCFMRRDLMGKANFLFFEQNFLAY
jgi:hypothetical protein